MTSERSLRFNVMAGFAMLGLIASVYCIVEAPREVSMGLVQKIFYFHVPSAWLCFLSAFLCAAAGIGVLLGRGRNAQAWFDATAELTVVFGACVLISGPLWARRAWGTYWQWDVRLTTSLLLWVIFAAILFVRRYGGPGGIKLAAGLAIFGAADVPLIYGSVSWWRTIHPKTTVVMSLDRQMRLAFWLSMLTFTLMYFVLVELRVRLARSESLLDETHRRTEDLEDLV